MDKYGRKASWIVKRYEKKGRSPAWMVKIQNKSKLKSEKIWKIQKESKLNGEKIWKLWKKSKLNMEIEPMRWQNPVSREAAAAIYPRVAAAAAAIGLKFHPKHVTNKNKTKHIMKISHISFIWKIPSLEYYTTYPKTTNFCKKCNYWRHSPSKWREDNQWKC